MILVRRGRFSRKATVRRKRYRS